MHNEINPEKKGRNVTQKKRRRISRFCALFSTKTRHFWYQNFQRDQAFLACSFLGQQFKVKPAIVLYSSKGIKPRRTQERHAGKSRENLISVHVCFLCLFTIYNRRNIRNSSPFCQWNESKPSKLW